MSHRLDTLSTTFLVVASMLGTGILTTTGIILSLVKTPQALVAVWVLGGVLAWFGAYCYGVIARAMPRNGGEAMILRETFSPALGEIAGWTSFVVGFAASNAATSLALAAYLEAALPGLPLRAEVIACAALLAVTALHGLFGRSGLHIQTLLAVIKFSLLAGLALYGLFLAGPAAPAAAPGPAPADGFGADWGVAMMLVMFAYSGWNAAIYVAAEVKNPGCTARNAMVIGTTITLLLYVSVNLAVLRQLPPEQIEGVIPIIAVLVKSLFGEGASEFFSGLVAFALLSSLGASTFLGPRVLAAMLAWFGERRGGAQPPPAPVAPALIWLQAGVSIAMVVTGTFEQILTVMGFLLGFFPILCVFGLYRSVMADKPVPAVARYLFGPLFIVAMTVILVQGAMQRPVEVMVALALVSAFFLLRQGMRRFA